MRGIPSILYALLDEYCLLIFSGKTMPWYLSMAMHVMVRMPVTIAVVCTKGTVLQTRTPAGNKKKNKHKNRGVKQWGTEKQQRESRVSLEVHISPFVGAGNGVIPFSCLWGFQGNYTRTVFTHNKAQSRIPGENVHCGPHVKSAPIHPELIVTSILCMLWAGLILLQYTQCQHLFTFQWRFIMKSAPIAMQ